jgi:septation ring formation regulator EzrA
VDVTQFFVAGLGLGFAVLGWFARELWSAVQSLRKDLSALQVQIATDYVRYDRLAEALQPIKDALDEIKATLSQKADK